MVVFHVFKHVFKLYKWYQIAQNISYLGVKKNIYDDVLLYCKP